MRQCVSDPLHVAYGEMISPYPFRYLMLSGFPAKSETGSQARGTSTSFSGVTPLPPASK
jgi:hypothetical protein